MSVQIKQQVLDGLQQLSSEDQQSVLNLVISLQNKQSQPSNLSESPQSFLETAKAFIGRAEGPGDLSTNPDYMQGYGTESTAEIAIR